MTDIVVQGRAGHAQKERQGRPVLEHVGDGGAQAGVGFDQVVVELLAQPRLEVRQQRTARGLVDAQALCPFGKRA